MQFVGSNVMEVMQFSEKHLNIIFNIFIWWGGGGYEALTLHPSVSRITFTNETQNMCAARKLINRRSFIYIMDHNATKLFTI